MKSSKETSKSSKEPFFQFFKNEAPWNYVEPQQENLGDWVKKKNCASDKYKNWSWPWNVSLEGNFLNLIPIVVCLELDVVWRGALMRSSRMCCAVETKHLHEKTMNCPSLEENFLNLIPMVVCLELDVVWRVALMRSSRMCCAIGTKHSHEKTVKCAVWREFSELNSMVVVWSWMLFEEVLWWDHLACVVRLERSTCMRRPRNVLLERNFLNLIPIVVCLELDVVWRGALVRSSRMCRAVRWRPWNDVPFEEKLVDLIPIVVGWSLMLFGAVLWWWGHPTCVVQLERVQSVIEDFSHTAHAELGNVKRERLGSSARITRVNSSSSFEHKYTTHSTEEHGQGGQQTNRKSIHITETASGTPCLIFRSAELREITS